MEKASYHRLLLRQIRRYVRNDLEEELAPFFESVSAFYIESEKERRLAEHILDVNSKELEAANKELQRRHQEMHDSILNALNVGLFAVDPNGKIIFSNHSASALLGMGEGDLVGKNIQSFVVGGKMAHGIETGDVSGRQEGDARLRNAQDAEIPIRYSAYPMLDNGIAKGTVFSFHDISLEQKRQELIDVQQLALESSATMMLIADANGHIQYANAEFIRFSGYSQEEIEGKDTRLIADETINDPAVIEECWKSVRAGQAWEGELLARTNKGGTYYEELTLTPLIEKGQVTHYVVVKKNITERIRVQEELKQARDEAITAMNQAQEANRAKDTFLSNMSHELRTPLNAIIGFSQILLAKADTSPTVKGLIDKIHISGKNLLLLVNSILDFSKIESGKMEIHKFSFLMHELINEVKILIEPMADKRSLQIAYLIPQEVSVYADRQLIKQVAVNLLSNAIKFSPEGGRVEFGYRVSDANHEFCVVDQGPGIPPEKFESLFEPFVQIREHQSDAVKGTGLGLSIVKKIIQMHGGKIWIESVVGSGSRFCFTIPLQRQIDKVG